MAATVLLTHGFLELDRKQLAVNVGAPVVEMVTDVDERRGTPILLDDGRLQVDGAMPFDPPESRVGPAAVTPFWEAFGSVESVC